MFGRKARLAEELHRRHHVGKSLSTAGLGRTEDISAVEDVGDGARLNLSGLLEAQLGHGFLSHLTEGQL